MHFSTHPLLFFDCGERHKLRFFKPENQLENSNSTQTFAQQKLCQLFDFLLKFMYFQ